MMLLVMNGARASIHR